MSTYNLKAKDIKQDWYIIDASDKVLGRLASFVASRLRGKHKPIFTPHLDTGDFIVITNASKIKVTGNKMNDKLYHRHSGYPGGITSTPMKEVMAKSPTTVIEAAVKRMLPRGPLGRQMLRKLKVYADANHPHTAQQPQPLEVEK